MVNLFIFNNRTTDTGSIGEAEERIFSFSCTEDGFSECCAVDIIFYCDRNMETLAGTDPFDGCYERYASATALVKMVSAVDPSLTNGRQIFANLERPEIKAVVNKWIDEIVLGLATLIHIFNPSCVVLGGGIMVQPYILEQIHARIPQMVMSSFAHVQISSAELGNSAGLLGAYYLASQKL